MENTMKLFKVNLKGVGRHSVAFVVAENAGDAYSIVRDDMNEKNIGTFQNRILDSVEYLAEDSDFPETTKLYVQRKLDD